MRAPRAHLVGHVSNVPRDLHHAEAIVAFEAEELVDPEGHAVRAGLVGQGDAGRTAYEGRGVEDVVDPLGGAPSAGRSR